MSSNAATLSNLLNQMNQNQEVLQGWDAVVNLLEEPVNDFLQSQWHGMTDGKGQLSISTLWCEGVNRVPGNQGYFTNVHRFDAILGAPLFQFQSGQSQVTVRQDIQAGTLWLGTMSVPANFDPSRCDCTSGDPRVDWGSPATVDTSRGPYLSGTVTLDQVMGLMGEGIESVVLDFAKGAFNLNGLSVTSVSDVDLVDALKNWFSANRIRYLLASVNHRNLGASPALTPKAFRFNVLTTNAGNTIVQLLITTDGAMPTSTVISVNEPIPTADGLTCSLMVSSRILYQQILAAGFNSHGGQFSLYAQPQGNPTGVWFAFLSPQMHFAGSFSYGNCCNRTTVTYDIYLGGAYTGTATEGFALSQQVHTSGNAPVDIAVSARYPVSLSGSGPGQTLAIVPGEPSVSVSGAVEDQIKSGLEGILNNDVRNAMASVSFASVSLFALESILFPGSLMTMRQAQVPGDLLIVGIFQPR